MKLFLECFGISTVVEGILSIPSTPLFMGCHMKILNIKPLGAYFVSIIHVIMITGKKVCYKSSLVFSEKVMILHASNTSTMLLQNTNKHVHSFTTRVFFSLTSPKSRPNHIHQKLICFVALTGSRRGREHEGTK